MEWIPIFVAVIRSVAFQRIEAATRGHWLALVSYCGQVENGGRIEGAQTWTARDWLIGVGLDLADVHLVVDSGLAAWEGDDLTIAHYDATAEDRCNARRERARIAALASHAPTAKRPRKGSPASSTASSTASSSAPSSAPCSADQREDRQERDHRTGQESTHGPAREFELTTPTSTAGQKPTPLDRHRADAMRLWELQEDLRTAAIKGTRRRPATNERLERIAERLAGGATVADCEHVLRVRAAEAKRGGAGAEYFNGETNWRANPFEFALGQPDPAINPPRNGAARDVTHGYVPAGPPGEGPAKVEEVEW